MFAVLAQLMTRDLRALAREIEAYPDDESLWLLPPGITNSSGTLVLHLVGNLKHFVGGVLGQTGYVRDREAEFSTHGLTRSTLHAAVTEAEEIVRSVLGSMNAKVTSAPADQEYPLTVAGLRLPTGLFLAHLAGHLAYHLGQVDFHRRFVTREARGVDALAISELVG